MKVLGIDPGKSGGAVLLEDHRVLGVHRYSHEDDFIDFMFWCKEQGTDAAFIEEVGSMPGNSGKSMFTFGDNFGGQRMCVRMLNIPLHRVRPQKWQAGLGLPKESNKTKHKNNLKNRANELYPNPDERWTLATCDAVLIARYGINSLSRTGHKS